MNAPTLGELLHGFFEDHLGHRRWLSHQRTHLLQLLGGESGGLPGRLPSARPAKPFRSKRRTQLTKVRGESPKNPAVC
jgi:hypothetical protein